MLVFSSVFGFNFNFFTFKPSTDEVLLAYLLLSDYLIKPLRDQNMFAGVETLHAGDVVGREREVPEDHDDASGSPSSVGRRTSQVKKLGAGLFVRTKKVRISAYTAFPT